MNAVEFVPPAGKHVRLFEQFSPMGSSRIVADAASIDEHINRACGVQASPKKDPSEHVDADLLSGVKLLSHLLPILRLLCAKGK